jgi:DNA polymerase III sliding clamp (beta) subunit (PCNA family)
MVSLLSLFRELSLTQGVVEHKTTIPILSNLLFQTKGNRLTITATDLELSIRTFASCLCQRRHIVRGTFDRANAKKQMGLPAYRRSEFRTARA